MMIVYVNGVRRSTFEDLIAEDIAVSGDITLYDPTNDGNPQFRIGSADANEGHIQAVYDAGAQTLDYLEIATDSTTEGDIYLNPASKFVGINQPSPSQPLHITHTGNQGIALTYSGGPTSQWRQTSTGSFVMEADIGDVAANSRIEIKVDNTELMRIMPGPLIGIGVDDPDTPLEVYYAGTQLKLSFDGTDNCTFGVDTNGIHTVTPSGGIVDIVGNLGLNTTAPQTIATQVSAAGTIFNVVSSASYGRLVAQGNLGSMLELVDSGASANQKVAQIRSDGGDCYFETVKDDGSAIAQEWFRVDMSNGYVGFSGLVGIGVNDPDTPLEVYCAGTQQKWSYDATNYATAGVGATGVLTLTPSGSQIALAATSLVLAADAITATSEGVAASVNTIVTEITTNGDVDLDNVTLANGTAGQVKKFVVKAVGNAGDSVKITPATMVGGTQITFAASPLGLGCEMIYTSAGWVVSANNGGTIS